MIVIIVSLRSLAGRRVCHITVVGIVCERIVVGMRLRGITVGETSCVCMRLNVLNRTPFSLHW